MDKMRMETPDLTDQNIEKIGALFPNCITETTDENGKLKKRTLLTLTEGFLCPCFLCSRSFPCINSCNS